MEGVSELKTAISNGRGNKVITEEQYKQIETWLQENINLLRENVIEIFIKVKNEDKNK